MSIAFSQIRPLTRQQAEERYEIIAVRGDRRDRLAYAPDGGGIGVALVTLRDEGTITGADQIGIRDAVARKWIVNPYAGGR